MADTTLSPNMNLPVPNVSVAPGPDWATDINACLSGVDSHTHASGQGVAVTPAGLNINSDLTFTNNNATDLRTSRFTSQSAPIAATGADLDCTYVSGGDLYYNDGAGNQVRITQSGTVTGSTGTITGLPSGTASASFSGATFTFQSATSTPATMAVGPLVIGRNAASSKTVTLTPDAAQASNYGMTLPAALPAASNYVTLDNTGAISYNTGGATGAGAVVLSSNPAITTAILTSPTISGATISSPAFSGTVTGSIAASTYSPTLVAVVGSSPVQRGVFRYMRINDEVHVMGSYAITTGLSGESQVRISVPIAPTNNFSAGDVSGVQTPIDPYDHTYLIENAGTKTVLSTVFFTGFNSGESEIVFVSFMYSCA